MIHSPKMLANILGYDYQQMVQYALWMKDDDSRKKCYYKYEKKKSNGKVRVIAPSFGKVRDFQNRLMCRVFSHVQFPYYVVGSVKKRSGALNAKMHSGKLFHLQTDLTSFFDFVGYREVYKALMSLNFSPDVARLITQLTTYMGHLPQGAPTSPFLANLVGLNIDEAFLRYCLPNDITYSRYVDDITFSSNVDFKKDTFSLLAEIVDAGFLYSHRKTQYKVGNIEITGAGSGCNGIHPTERQIDKLFDSDTSLETKKGLYGYFNYLEKVGGFSLTQYKKAFKVLKFPEKVLPHMNRPTLQPKKTSQ